MSALEPRRRTARGETTMRPRAPKGILMFNCNSTSMTMGYGVALMAMAGCLAGVDEGDEDVAEVGDAVIIPPLIVTTTERVDLSSAEAQTLTGDSRTPSFSGNRRFVAFASDDSTLTAGASSVTTNIYLRDLQSGTTELVSVNTSEVTADGDCVEPVVSADGRYVAFTSFANNLFAESVPIPQVYLRDRVAGTTRLMSVGNNGAPNGPARSPSISADGALIVYESFASNLNFNDPDTNDASDIFLRFRDPGGSIRLSLTSSEAQANGDSFDPEISADGLKIVFASDATNLAQFDLNNTTDVFVRDRFGETTRRVSTVAFTTFLKRSASGTSDSPTINEDGSAIAFVSTAADLVAGDDEGFDDIFVERDGDITRVSENNSAAGANADSFEPSASGAFVAFVTDATNLSALAVNGLDHVYVGDTVFGPVLASLDTNENIANGNSGAPSLRILSNSVPPKFEVVFESRATNLVAGDTNALQDIFLRSQRAP
jgi:Tol biopolymer transport system component